MSGGEGLALPSTQAAEPGKEWYYRPGARHTQADPPGLRSHTVTSGGGSTRKVAHVSLCRAGDWIWSSLGLLYLRADPHRRGQQAAAYGCNMLPGTALLDGFLSGGTDGGSFGLEVCSNPLCWQGPRRWPLPGGIFYKARLGRCWAYGWSGVCLNS